MNIFVSSKDPIQAAIVLDDKRLVKMCLETCQLLSTTMHIHSIKNAPYKPTHKNHPATKWASESKENFKWLLAHFEALLAEYTFRFNRVHKCEQYVISFYEALWHLPTKKLTPFTNCTPYKQLKNIEVAYKLTLQDKWAKDKYKPKWTNRTPPWWKSIKNENNSI
jgi:hypothetical protein